MCSTSENSERLASSCSHLSLKRLILAGVVALAELACGAASTPPAASGGAVGKGGLAGGAGSPNANGGSAVAGQGGDRAGSSDGAAGGTRGGATSAGRGGAGGTLSGGTVTSVASGGAIGGGAGGTTVLGTGGVGTGGASTTGGGTGGRGGAGGSASVPPTAAGGADGGIAGASSSGINWDTSVGGAPAVSGTPVSGTVTVNHAQTSGKLPPGYAGFSTEKTHITDPYFTPNDAALIALFRLLGPGYLRIGGADVERCTWQANAALGTAGHPVYNIGTAAVDQLAGFLQATGWKAIYGLPVASATAAQTGAEATYAASKLGASLAWFELGNEPGSWSTYKPKWEAAAAAVLAGAPAAKLAGPAQTGSTSYDSTFASDEDGKFTVITHHYYRDIGTSPNATIANMLSPNSGVASTMSALAAIVKAHTKITDGFRLGETNSYWHHGSPNVSNTFAAGVWGVDYMLETAQDGCSGVHFHGGGMNMDGNNCSGGLSTCTSPFVYSPIAEDASQVAIVQGVFYAMLVISQAGTGNLLSTSVSASGVNVRAYSLALADGSTEVVLINKDMSSAVNLAIDVGATVTSAKVAYLLGPSPSATTGMTFAGSGVGITGSWAPNTVYNVPVSGGSKLAVAMPAVSAAILRAR